jgi:hypothetical protein
MNPYRFFPLALLAAGLILTHDTVRAEPGRDNFPPEGFRALFNGKDLGDWRESGNAPEHWTVQDGVLVFDGEGRALFTVEEFRNYVLLVDWKVEKNGNSGVFLRGKGTQVEINDRGYSRKRLWNGTSGGLYPDLPPTKHAAKPTGEWNHFEIRVEKGVVTVLFNGEKTVDGFKKDWRDQASGPIGFQNHGTPVWLKNIYVKKLED